MFLLSPHKFVKGKILHMEIVTWTEQQVKRNLQSFGTVEMNSNVKNRKRKQRPLTLENENGDKFECTFDMQGTIPGGSTLKLLNELSSCATNLNEFEFDDSKVEKMAYKIIRMVSTKFHLKN